MLTIPSIRAYGRISGLPQGPNSVGRRATRAAFKVYEDMQAPTLTKDVADSAADIAKIFGIKTPPTPMSFLEANEGRAYVSWGKGDEFSSNC